MKLLLDQGLPRTAAQILRSKGHDVLHVAEIGLAAATDFSILKYAGCERCIVVTLDADFHALMMLNRANTPSVIRLRMEGLKGEALALLILKVISSVSEDLLQGALVTVTQRSIRVHLL